MAVEKPLLERFDDNGDATVTVYSRTADGDQIHIVIGRDQLGTQDMYDMLAAAGARTHSKRAAIQAAQRNEGG